jgi:hypothetical protein
MTNDDFSEIFEGTDLAAIEAEFEALEAAKPARPLKRDGLSYVQDETRPDETRVSVYALRAEGKTLLWVKVDLSCTVEAPHGIKYLGKAVSWHPMYVVSADGKTSVETTGRAVLAQHKGGAVHVDGMSVQAFIIPRALRFLAQVYGV